MHRFSWVLVLAAAASLAEAAESRAKFYGDNVRFDDLELTSDGGMVVLGELSCNEYDDCDPGESRPFNDEACWTWVAKLDRSGEVVWQKCYGERFASSILPTRDGGFLVMGESGGLDNRGIFLVKLDPQGGVRWHKSYYVSSSEAVSLAAAAETETGYVVVGESEAPNCCGIWFMQADFGGGEILRQWCLSHRVEDTFWAGAARRPL